MKFIPLVAKAQQTADGAATAIAATAITVLTLQSLLEAVARDVIALKAQTASLQAAVEELQRRLPVPPP